MNRLHSNWNETNNCVYCRRSISNLVSLYSRTIYIDETKSTMVSEGTGKRCCLSEMRWMKWEEGGATETIVHYLPSNVNIPSLLLELAESLTELEDLRRSLRKSEERIQELEKEKEKRERKRREVSSF